MANLRGAEGNLFIRYTAVWKAWSQKERGRDAWLRRERPNSTMWRCFLSTIPFWWCVSGQVSLWTIPNSDRKEEIWTV